MTNQAKPTNTKPVLSHMTAVEMKAEQWKKGDTVWLTNIKDYLVMNYNSNKPVLYLYRKKYRLNNSTICAHVRMFSIPSRQIGN